MFSSSAPRQRDKPGISEILEIAIIDTTGETLLDSIVMPEGRISSHASVRHGLTRPTLKEMGAKPWEDIHDQVAKLLSAASVIVIYNVEFGRRMLEQTCTKAGLPMIHVRSWECAMLSYSDFRGEPTYEGQSKWHKLESAYSSATNLSPFEDRRALADCKMTLEVMRSVARKTHPSAESMSSGSEMADGANPGPAGCGCLTVMAVIVGSAIAITLFF